MNLTGDPEGLAALKSFQEGNRDYLKFLIQEARTVFEHQVDFKSPEGAQFRLHFDVKTGDFRWRRSPSACHCKKPFHQRKLQLWLAVPSLKNVFPTISTTVPS